MMVMRFLEAKQHKHGILLKYLKVYVIFTRRLEYFNVLYKLQYNYGYNVVILQYNYNYDYYYYFVPGVPIRRIGP